MTDNNDIRIGISYETDESSVARASKSADTVEAKITGIGARIEKSAAGATALQKELGQLSRAAQIDDIARDMGMLAKETGETGEAVADLTKKLKALGATDTEIKGAARAFESARRGSGGGIGTDFAGDAASSQAGLRGALDVFSGGNSGAVGGILEFGEAIADVGEFAPKAASQLFTLAGAMGPAGLLAAGAAGIALAALGVAIKVFTDEASKRAETVRNIIEANKDARTKAIDGATTDDFEKDIARMAELRQLEVDQIAQNAKLFKENFVLASGEVNALAQAFDTLDDELAASTAASEAAIKKYDIAMQAHRLVIEEGGTAANDAAEKHKKLAEELTKTTLDSAAAAGQEEAARRKALDATEEQNQARLKSIEDERAAIEAQLQVLQSSGDTSEAVTAQIDSLNGSLSALGKESDFIKNTALAASKARDAEKKAAKEAEEAAKKAAQAQEQYTNAVAGAKQAFADAKVDIKQGLKDTVTDINRTFADTLAEGTIEFHQSELKEEREHQRDLAGIRRDAQRTEAEATRERDFAALADARQDAADALMERQEDERAANDEQLTEFRQGREAQARDRDIGLREAQIDSQRQLRDAATARDRGIRDAQAALDAQSKQQNQFYNNSLGMAQKYYDSLMNLQSRAMGIGGAAAGGRQSAGGQRRAAPAGRGFEDMLNFVMN